MSNDKRPKVILRKWRFNDPNDVFGAASLVDETPTATSAVVPNTTRMVTATGAARSHMPLMP